MEGRVVVSEQPTSQPFGAYNNSEYLGWLAVARGSNVLGSRYPSSSSRGIQFLFLPVYTLASRLGASLAQRLTLDRNVKVKERDCPRQFFHCIRSVTVVISILGSLVSFDEQ